MWVRFLGLACDQDYVRCPIIPHGTPQHSPMPPCDARFVCLFHHRTLCEAPRPATVLDDEQQSSTASMTPCNACCCAPAILHEAPHPVKLLDTCCCRPAMWTVPQSSALLDSATLWSSMLPATWLLYDALGSFLPRDALWCSLLLPCNAPWCSSMPCNYSTTTFHEALCPTMLVIAHC